MPEKPSRPGQSGRYGVRLSPVATTTADAVRSPAEVVQPPAVRRSVDPGDLDPELRTDAEPLGVRLEIAHQIVAGDPLAVVPRDSCPGQPGESSGGVQPKAVVSAAPGCADRVGPLQDRERNLPPAQLRRDGQPAAPAPMMIVCAATLAPLRRGAASGISHTGRAPS